MAKNLQSEIVWKGRHLSMASRGSWEFATRNTAKPVVGIVALTNDQRVVLVEQYRPPIDGRIIELPAGLAGDIAGAEDESLIEAAKRELLEETGYSAQAWSELGTGYSSPGLTDESMVLYLAERLEKTGPGGGDASESIVIHEVPLGHIYDWLREKDLAVDLKLLAGVYAAQMHLEKRGE